MVLALALQVQRMGQHALARAILAAHQHGRVAGCRKSNSFEGSPHFGRSSVQIDPGNFLPQFLIELLQGASVPPGFP